MNLIRSTLRIKGKILETERRHGKNPHYEISQIIEKLKIKGIK